MTLNQTANVLSVPFSLLLMTLVMPYDKLSQIAGSSQLTNANEVPIFLKAIKPRLFYPRDNRFICGHPVHFAGNKKVQQ